MFRILIFVVLSILCFDTTLCRANQDEVRMNPMISQDKRMFLVLLKYIQPLERVDEFVPAHVEFLKACYEQSQFIFSGPRIPRTGGIILANVESLEAVWSLIKEDPFYIHQIAEFEVIEFKPWMHDHRFDCFMHDQQLVSEAVSH
jgi:uncharacterized protein YciI